MFIKKSSGFSWGLLVLLALIIVSRVLTAEQFPAGLDSGNFLLGMFDYSVAQDRPHSPGYPVHIALASVINVIVDDPHTSLIILSIVWSLVAVIGTYMFALEFLDRRAVLLATALLAVNPLFWFYGSVAETYTFDAALAPLLMVGLHRARRPATWLFIGLGVGLACGSRPTSIVLLLPAIAAVVYHRRKHALPAPSLIHVVMGIVIGLGSWIVPAIILEGGVQEYVEAIWSITHNSGGGVAGNTASLVSTLVWTVNIAVAIPLIGWSKRAQHPWWLMFWWTLPPLTFFATMHHQKGYLLLVLPMWCIMLASMVWTSRHPRLYGSALVLIWAVVFLGVPYTEPPDIVGQPRGKRPVGHVISALTGRLFSVYLPSLDRIRTSDRSIADAEALVASEALVAPSALVVIDGVARLHVQARVLQARAVDHASATHGITYADVEAGITSGLTIYPGIRKIHGYRVESSDSRPIIVLTRTTFVGAYDGLTQIRRRDAGGFTLLVLDDAFAAHARLRELFVP